MKKIFDFIVRSSADPRAVSLTVKMTLLGLIPYLMQATDLVCQYGHSCMLIDASLLETFVETITASVFYTLTLISTLGVIYGLGRKIWRTVIGETETLKDVV
jgi:hypothetical protein